MVFNIMNVKVALRYPLVLPLYLVRSLLECKLNRGEIMIYKTSFQVRMDLKKVQKQGMR